MSDTTLSPTIRWLVLALLAAATCAAFAGVLHNGWILLDDPVYVTRDPHVARGWTLAGALWFLHAPHGQNWHPLTSYSHMLDVQLFGLRPGPHHAVSLALHALNAVLLALVLSRLTGTWWRSVLVAAFFALHPLRVESVAWIAERKDVLSGLFFLLALEAYRRWVARPAPGRYALLLATFVLGLMSKPMLVTLPFVLLLLDVWPLGRLATRRELPRRLVEKWPLFALALASSVVTFVVQRATDTVVPAEALPFARRAANAVISCWRYVGLTLWPNGLAPYHPLSSDAPAVAAAAAVGLAAVTAAAILQRRRPFLAVGWLWYLGMLVPVIGLVQVGGQAYADRYTYLPAIGLLVAVVWGVADLVGRTRAARIAAGAASVVALAALALATSRQVSWWRDTRTLFAHTLAVTRDNRFAHQALGMAYLEEGEARLAAPQLAQALGLPPDYEDGLRRALETRPDDLETRRALASLLARESRAEAAVEAYREILRRNPDDLDALDNVAWIRATNVEAAHRNGAEAVRLAEELCAKSPEPDPVIYSTLAAAYAEDGRLPAAVRACERAIQLARAARAPAKAARYERQLACYRAGRPFHFGAFGE